MNPKEGFEGLSALVGSVLQQAPEAWRFDLAPVAVVSEVLCLGSVCFSSVGSDFTKARQRPAVPPEPRGYGGA